MKKTWQCFVILLLITAHVLFVVENAFSKTASKKTKKTAYQIGARTAILVDGEHGFKKLYDKRSTLQVPPASTTKVMTALLVIEKLPLDREIKISKTATRVVPTKIDLQEGEVFKVRDLLYASLLKSANDASIALAEAVAGSEKAFVRMMNKRAKQLGAQHTIFANSHGLPTEATQYTTAHDMVLIFREAMKKSFFRIVIQQEKKIISSKNGRKIILYTHNKALSRGWKRKVYGKTGYTRTAGPCFVGYVEKDKKRTYIAVFNSSKRWDDIKYLIQTKARIAL